MSLSTSSGGMGPEYPTRIKIIQSYLARVSFLDTLLPSVNTREVAFILGFLVGVMVDRLLQVIVDLVIVHHL